MVVEVACKVEVAVVNPLVASCVAAHEDEMYVDHGWIDDPMPRVVRVLRHLPYC